MRGVYVSDWAGTHDTYEAVNFGLDIEMGTSEKYDEYFLAKPYLEGLKNGKYDEETLNDKVRRILKVLYAIGKFDSQRCAGARNIKEHQEIAYEGAVEAAVLLKNDGVLPFDADKIKTLAVLGDNATRQHHAGGQSSAVKALYEISPLEAIQRKFGDKLEILHTKSYPETVGQLLSIESETMATVDQGSGTKGWIFDAFSHEWDDEYLIHREFTEAVKFDLNNAPVYITETMKEKGYYLRWRGNYESLNKQILKLAFDTNTEAMLHVDGELLIAVEAESGINFKAVEMQVESGRSYEMQIILRVYKSSNSFKFGICRK